MEVGGAVKKKDFDPEAKSWGTRNFLSRFLAFCNGNNSCAAELREAMYRSWTCTVGETKSPEQREAIRCGVGGLHPSSRSVVTTKNTKSRNRMCAQQQG